MKTKLQKLLEETVVEHTAMPWVVTESYDEEYFLIQKGDSGEAPTFVPEVIACTQNNKVDATFITHCVNSHEDLRQLAAMAGRLMKSLRETYADLQAEDALNGVQIDTESVAAEIINNYDSLTKQIEEK